MRKKYNKTKLRAAFLSLLTIALLAATAAFIGTSAANAVSGSDLAASGSDISSTYITALADEIPADLGEPKIVMTTGKAVGETLSFSLNISTAYVDWGDGNIFQETGTSSYQYSYSGTLVGNTVKIYSTVDTTYLNCYYNNLTALDVSKNTALDRLECGGNNLATLDVSNNTALTWLSCSKTNLTTLDVSNNTALDMLECNDNNLTTLDVSNNTALTWLKCSNNNLTSLDVSNNTALGHLYCDDNNLTTLDVSKNTNLAELGLIGNNLTSLDVSNNTYLVTLRCSDNDLTTLDVSKNTELMGLTCGNNKLTELDVSEHTGLLWLECEGNKLTELDVSNNTVLEWLICNGNNLTTLDVSKNTDLSALRCDENSLKFSTIKISGMSINTDSSYDGLFYSPQSDVQIVASIKANQTIDLSSECETTGELTLEYYDESGNSTTEKRTGAKTVYKWFDSSDKEVTPTKSENGVFTFGDEFVGKTLYCTMTNALYPDLTLKTTAVTVEPDLGEPKIVMTTGKAVGETLSFSLNISTAYIDWGDGNIVQCGPTYCGELKGQTVKIYSEKDNISYFEFVKGDIAEGMYDQSLIKLDLSNCIALTRLICCGSNLTELDLSKNVNLTYVECEYNNLTKLDVSGCTALENLNCMTNNLTELDVSKNTALTGLACGENNLSELDVSTNTALTVLGCWDNNLSELDVSNHTDLTMLNCECNNITELVVSKNTDLQEFTCWDNKLKFSTMKISLPAPKVFVYSPQADVEIAASVKTNETIDLSSEYDINGTKTVYKWFDSSDNEVTPTKSENGVFKFGDEFVGKTLYCTMTNALYPDLTLKTTTVDILKSDFTVEDNVGVVEDVEPSDGIIIRDKDGNIVDLNGVKLIVGNIETNKKKTVLEAIERYNKEFKADSTDCALYDISLVDSNGAKVYIEDGGRIKIKLKYPDNLGRESEDYTYHLYHQNDDGSIEEIAINCEPNGIWFYADEFSPYALTWSLKQSGGTDTGNEPGTGESIALTIVASCLAMLSLAAIGAVVYRKKFARSAK